MAISDLKEKIVDMFYKLEYSIDDFATYADLRQYFADSDSLQKYDFV